MMLLTPPPYRHSFGYPSPTSSHTCSLGILTSIPMPGPRRVGRLLPTSGTLNPISPSMASHYATNLESRLTEVLTLNVPALLTWFGWTSWLPFTSPFPTHSSHGRTRLGRTTPLYTFFGKSWAPSQITPLPIPLPLIPNILTRTPMPSGLRTYNRPSPCPNPSAPSTTCASSFWLSTRRSPLPMNAISPNANHPVPDPSPGGTLTARRLPNVFVPLVNKRMIPIAMPNSTSNGLSDRPNAPGLPKSSTTHQSGRSLNGGMAAARPTLQHYGCQITPSPKIMTLWRSPSAPAFLSNRSLACSYITRMTPHPYPNRTLIRSSLRNWRNISEPHHPPLLRALPRSPGPYSNG